MKYIKSTYSNYKYDNRHGVQLTFIPRKWVTIWHI